MSDSPLSQRLRDRVRENGPIPFRAFMEAALYDPEEGYYARSGFTTGRRGDFATAPDVGKLLGATLANAVEAFAREGGQLVEVGPGSGRLIVDVLEALPRDAVQALDVVLVEPFAVHRERLWQRVRDAGVEPRVVEDLSNVDAGRSLLVANELLDALPAEVVRARDGPVQRLLVDVEGDAFSQVWAPAPGDLAERVAPIVEHLPHGHRYEFAPALDEIVEDVARVLDPGAAVFLDYGDRFENVWPNRPDGTLRAFREHRHVDPLTRPGETDVTYDVDFTRAMELGEGFGLGVRAFGPQERLLVHLGLMEAARERSAFLQAKQLLVPGAFAGRFMGLVLGRGGVAEDARLKVDLDDPGLWDRGLAEPLGDLEGDLGASLTEEMEQASGLDPLDRNG